MALLNYYLPVQRKVEQGYKRSNRFMRVIAAGRFAYGIVLLGLGLTIFNLIGKNLADELLALVNKLHISSHIYYVHWLLQKVSTVSTGLLLYYLITVVYLLWELKRVPKASTQTLIVSPLAAVVTNQSS